MSFKAKQPSDEQLSFIGPSPYILQPDLASTFTQGDGYSSRTRWVGEDMAELEGRVFFVLPALFFVVDTLWHRALPRQV